VTGEARSGWLGRPRRLVALAVGLVMLSQVAPSAAQQQSTQEKLSTAEQRVAQIQRELSRIQARRDALRAEVESLTTQIAQAYAQAQALRGTIQQTKEVIDRKGKRMRRLQGRLDDRARTAYMQGPSVLLEFVLEADSLADLSDRVTFLSALSQTDADVAAGLEVEREEMGRFEQDLAGYLDQQKELLADLREQNRVLEEKFAEQQRLTERTEAKLAEAREVVQDLRQQRRREILAEIRRQQAAAATPVAPAGGGSISIPPGQGLLDVCPVDPPRSYINDFGFPRSGGRTHQGNDIFAPAGTPIRAAFSGVARESYNSLGGNSVFVTRSDGTYVYNAHLSSYAGVNGQQVNAGDVIGYVGNTGNAVGTPPHNHFQLHPGGGSAINPYPHLNLVCGVNGSG
jgi:peptidoglycan LD-endopeptidase LytH